MAGTFDWAARRMCPLLLVPDQDHRAHPAAAGAASGGTGGRGAEGLAAGCAAQPLRDLSQVAPICAKVRMRHAGKE